MKNEIKEILEYMGEIAECTFTTDTFELNFEDTKILLDYITNLQEENFKLKSKIIKSIHLLNHIEEYDYRIFEENLENILNGE